MQVMSTLLLMAAAYTALGTEPFWNLRADRIALRLDRLGEPLVIISRPTVTRRPNGRRYAARGMIVDVIHERCSDGMSDRIFPDRVTVRWRGQVLRGCGGRAIDSPPGLRA